MALRKAGAVARVRAEFPGEQPDERELGPLRNAKRPEQLLLGVFYGWRDRVHSGNGQRTPRARGFSSKVLRIEPRIKLNRGENEKLKTEPARCWASASGDGRLCPAAASHAPKAQLDSSRTPAAPCATRNEIETCGRASLF